MARLSSEAYINVVYDIIASEGIESVTIRYLAKKMNCSTATLYRHFDSLEQLIVFASLRFLKPYIEEVAAMENEQYSLEEYYKTWDIFLKYSFDSPQIFNYIFFNKYKDKLSTAVNQYYSFLGDELGAIKSSHRLIYTSGDLYLRDYQFLTLCIGSERFSSERIQNASDVIVYLYKGMLSALLEGRGFDTKKAREQFINSARLICYQFE